MPFQLAFEFLFSNGSQKGGDSSIDFDNQLFHENDVDFASNLDASDNRDVDFIDDSEYTLEEEYRQAQMEDSTVFTIRSVFAIIYSVLFVVGLANVLVLFIVARFRRMRTVTNLFIFNLCLADLVVITFLPFVVCFQLMRSWIFGEFVCKLFFIAESTTKFASVYFVGVLSVDRYLALCHPCWCKRNRHRLFAMVISAVGWLITAALMTPIYLYSTVIELAPNVFMCTVKWPVDNDDDDGEQRDPTNETFDTSNVWHFTSEHYFTIYSFLLCFGAPAMVIICFYFKIVEEMIRASRRAVRLRKRKDRTYKKITRMVLAVVTFYFLCWSPYWIMNFISTFILNGAPSIALRIFFNILHALPYLNCSLNPIMYSLMTESFRKTLRELFPWWASPSTDGRRPRSTTNVSHSHKRSTTIRQCPCRIMLNGQTYPMDTMMGAPEDCNHDGTIFAKSSVSNMSHSVQMVSDFSLCLLTSSNGGAIDSDSTKSTQRSSLETVNAENIKLQDSSIQL